MESLNGQERQCLLAIAEGKVQGEGDCSPGVLLHLMQRGLVLRRPLRALPLGDARHDYVLSSAGKMALERHDG